MCHVKLHTRDAVNIRRGVRWPRAVLPELAGSVSSAEIQTKKQVKKKSNKQKAGWREQNAKQHFWVNYTTWTELEAWDECVEKGNGGLSWSRMFRNCSVRSGSGPEWRGSWCSPPWHPLAFLQGEDMKQFKSIWKYLWLSLNIINKCKIMINLYTKRWMKKEGQTSWPAAKVWIAVPRSTISHRSYIYILTANSHIVVHSVNIFLLNAEV